MTVIEIARRLIESVQRKYVLRFVVDGDVDV
jgi:hypothetical protein